MIVFDEKHDQTDRSGTWGIAPASGEPERSGGRWPASAADLAVGSGLYLGTHPRSARLQRRVYFPLEQTVWAGAAGGAVQSPCRARPAQADPEAGGAGSGLDAEAQASRRIDTLEHAQAGLGAVDLPYDGGAGMGKARIETAAARPLHGFERSRLRGQSGRHYWAVCEPAGACRGVLRGREDGDPGARPQGPGVAAVARPGGAARL